MRLGVFLSLIANPITILILIEIYSRYSVTCQLELKNYFAKLKALILVSFVLFFLNGMVIFPNVSGYKISAVGDIPCNDIGEKIISQISNESTDMHIWLGDYGYKKLDHESVNCFIDLLVKNNLDLKNETSVLVIGNHEQNNTQTWLGLSGHDKSYYVKNVTNGIRLINIDSTTILSDSDQKKWLESELQKAMDSDIFTLVTLHTNLVGVGSVDSRGIKKYEFLHPLFEKYGVDLVLSGHNHAYYRVFSHESVDYVTIGTGGASKSKLNCCFNSTDQNPRFESDGYLILNIEGNGINGQFMSEGKILDEFAKRISPEN